MSRIKVHNWILSNNTRDILNYLKDIIMNDPDYKHVLFDLIYYIRDKAEYLRNEDALRPGFNADTYEGMKLAYSFVLDAIESTLKGFDLPLDYFGFDNYDPSYILNLNPKNHNRINKDQ